MMGINMKKTNKVYSSLRSLFAVASVVGLLTPSCTSWKKNQRAYSDDSDTAPRSAFEIYSQLQESATSFNAEAVLVDGQTVGDDFTGGVTFGAEKEASSSLLTRVMGPNGDRFKEIVSSLPDERREEFLRDFMTKYLKNVNSYRKERIDGEMIDYGTDVVDKEGNPKVIDLDALRDVNYETADLETLDRKFNQWVDMTDGRPLSFVRRSTRTKLWKGTLPGLTSDFFPNSGYSSWGSYVPHFGDAERYILDLHGHSRGWEIGFQPLNTYGEFEEMVAWFRKELKNAGQLFQAPGHQRMVFKVHPDLQEDKLAELYRGIQALIVVDGIKGKTGIESASFKSVQSDSSLASLNTARGVIRLERSRWGSDNMGIEFRAGTKDITVARFTQTSLAARVGSNDWEGLAGIGDYRLYDGSGNSAADLAARFGVDEEVASRALQNLRSIKLEYNVPFWHWETGDIPFMTRPKQEILKTLTRSYIEQAAELGEGNDQAAKELIREWVRRSNLSEELRKYIRPSRGFTDTVRLSEFPVPEGARVNVNQIDLGLEYTGRMPLKLGGEFTEERLADNKRAWITTRIDLSDEEREAIIKKVAKDLARNLGVENAEPELVGPGGHGHGLEIGYEIRDTQNRKWRVEWDGIGRSYDPAGNVIEGSKRAGSLELVTPKFTPTPDEMQAVFNAFGENNVLPRMASGGGHINVDLAAFEGNPKALGRFLSIFHEHRGVIALMFQRLNRLKQSEPAVVSPRLANALKNFDGTETELKQLLYNERYFNTRHGRKSRYYQVDMSAYMQDVIPEEFLTNDFDIGSPAVEWRRQFRADPRIRKLEFRMFNAPRDAAESALMIRLVKGMLNKALNEDSTLSGTVQKVDHEGYLANPDKAYADLEKMVNDLGLDMNDYRPAVAEGLSETDLQMRSVFYEPFEERMVMHPKQPGWGEALSEARPADQLFASEEREWVRGPADETNTISNEHRIRAAEEAMRRREGITPDRLAPGNLIRTHDCADALVDMI